MCETRFAAVAAAVAVVVVEARLMPQENSCFFFLLAIDECPVFPPSPLLIHARHSGHFLLSLHGGIYSSGEIVVTQ